MEIIKVGSKNFIEKTISVLSKNGIIIYPTETCYGVGVDATSTPAVTKLLKYKKRPSGKAISIAVSDFEMAKKYVILNNSATKIYRNFLPGPVTVISKSNNLTDPRLSSEKNTLGVRIPNYQILREIISKFNKPITSTSANSSGKKTPYSIKDILKNLSQNQKKLIDLILDAGELPVNPPSTVIDTTEEELTIYRSGRIIPKNLSVENLQSESILDTKNIGAKLIKSNFSNSPLIILLDGELGSGKTHMVKGIAEELGIRQMVKSPTYNYVNEYTFDYNGVNGKLYHLDSWRISNKADLESLGINQWVKKNNVVAVEWPSVILNLDPEFFKKFSPIFVEFVKNGENVRQIRVSKNNL